jgi:benzoylformate decarboxylase
VNQTNRPAPASLLKAKPDASRATAPLSPEKLWTTLDRVAPDNALWVSEAGGNEPLISSCIKARGPFSHLSAVGGGLGFGLPAAVGAQLAAPERPVVALMGDGSIQYAITALWTAASYKIPLIVIVASNAEYGVLKQFAGIEKISGVSGLDPAGTGRCCLCSRLRCDGA